MSRSRRLDTAKELLRRGLRRQGYELIRSEDPRFRRSPDEVPLAPDPDPRRLDELRARYALVQGPVVAHSYWNGDRVATVDPRRFRDHSMFVWQYLHRPAITELRYFTYLTHVEHKDRHGLLARSAEDGAFGAPVFAFPGRPPVSRDLLDSVNEILYLDRQLGILDAPSLRVVDVGAGYGRLAHRMAELVPGLVDYACLDAVPESTHLCEHYLRFRDVVPPCRVVELPDTASIAGDRFDLAVNVHSFSEMPRHAVEHWVELLADADVPALLVVPNAPVEVRSYEHDGSRLDLLPVLRAAGFELAHREPVIDDPAVRQLFGVNDHFHLFRRTPTRR